MLTQTITKVVKNQVVIVLATDSGSSKVLIAQGVYEHIAILPKHYVKCLQRGYKAGMTITIEPANTHSGLANHLRGVYAFDDSDFGIHPDTDLAWFRLPKSYPLFKDIRSLFWTDEDVGRPLDANAHLVVGPTSHRPFVKVAQVELEGFRPLLSVLDEDGSRLETRDVLSYNYSEKGACGSVLIAPNVTRPILSMHTAGIAAGVGFGTIITRELLNDFLPKTVVVQCEELDMAPLSDRAFVIDDMTVALDYIGEIPKDKRPHIPWKSKIRPSIIHNFMGLHAETEPAILSDKDPRYTHSFTPLYYGVRKHGLRSLDFPRSVVDRAKHALYEGWFGLMKPAVMDPKRLTYEQAIGGFPGVEFYDALKLNTSAGYPWTVKAERLTTKSEWIRRYGDKFDIHDELKSELRRKELLRQKGVVPGTIFVDTLKDERRPPDKVASEGGTRIFCASPVDYTIAMRQNFLHFCAAMMKSGLNVYSAVGINPKGKQWTDLFTRLNAKGGGVVFSRWTTLISDQGLMLLLLKLPNIY